MLNYDTKRGLDVGDQILRAMAAFVRANPTATVRELAAHLGFSEERSVYYWLQKMGYRGLREFKRHVIAGSGFDGGGDAWAREEEAPYALSQRVVTTSEYIPWILPGDRLEIAPQRPPSQGDLVLVDLPGAREALRRYYGQGALVHPVKPHEVHRLDAKAGRLLGVVVRLIRSRP